MPGWDILDLTETIIKPKEDYNQYVSVFREYLLLNEKFDIATTMKNIHGLLSFIDKVFSSPAAAQTFLYFCVVGASTAWTLQNELNMPEATAYRTLKRLRSMKLVSPALKVSKVKEARGGPRPTVWALEDTSDEEIAKALRLHYRLLSPKFQVAERVAQTILEEYVVKRGLKEISYMDIVRHVKELRVPFSTPDVAQLASTYLREKGIKVWS